ncbi:hypothetical protein DFH06DRAFT_200709 [Mycena polygramma]|nr:hypothetical protein DFH06DRAFT_200709 [Mycena polygramma]
MDAERDLPPIPVPPPVAESSRRHSHRSKASVRDLAALILVEQQEHRETQRELARVVAKLRSETLRADENERNLIEATERLKTVNEARLAAVREAARANESLGLYKFQLETAQNEINRAQTVFNIVERERYQAEISGAKSRTAARKLNEKHKIHLAREEGRRLGLREGFDAGRLQGSPDGRVDAPAPSNFGDSQRYDYDYDFDEELLNSPGSSLATEDLYSPLPPDNPSIPPPTPSPAPLPIPPPAPPPARAVSEAAQPSAPLSPLFVPLHDIHPTPVHNEQPHPRHEHITVPPDGFVPTTGPDDISIQIPPPHEFITQRQPTPPRNTGSSVVEEPGMAPSAFARALPARKREQSVRAESVRRPFSTAISVHPVQMPTPRTNSDLPGIERQAQQRSSWSSDFFGGGPPSQAQAPRLSDASSPIPINIQPPSRSHSHTSSGQVGTPSMGSKLFGPDAAVPRDNTRPLSRPSIYAPGPAPSGSPGFAPLGFQPTPDHTTGTSPMPGTYADASEFEGVEDPLGSEEYDHLGPKDINSLSTHSSDLQTSTPDTLTTPPQNRRPHPHKPPRVKNPAAWPRDPDYVRPPQRQTGPGFGYDENVASTSGTWS